MLDINRRLKEWNNRPAVDIVRREDCVAQLQCHCYATQSGFDESLSAVFRFKATSTGASGCKVLAALIIAVLVTIRQTYKRSPANRRPLNFEPSPILEPRLQAP